MSHQNEFLLNGALTFLFSMCERRCWRRSSSDLEGITLRIAIAAPSAGPPSHFLTILDVELLAMLFTLTGDYSRSTAKDAFAVAAPAHLVTPLFGYAG